MVEGRHIAADGSDMTFTVFLKGHQAIVLDFAAFNGFTHCFRDNPGNSIGDLGSGKTLFTKGFAQAMGIDEITSPTFTIIKEYVGELPLYHMDVYRLEDSKEDIGIEEYFDKGGVTIIEWADMIKDILPPERLDIKIKITGENTRVLILTPYGEKYTNICEAII